MSISLRTPKWTILLALLIYLLLLCLDSEDISTNDDIITQLHQKLDKEAQNFIALMPTPKQRFATSKIQNMLHCNGNSTPKSNSSCNAYSPSFDTVPDASSRICEYLAGTRIVFVGPLTTYHLHNIWLASLEDHEGHSLSCPGPEFCVFHHICFPGRNSSSFQDGRNQRFPKNTELRETRSAVLQYALSTSLIAHTDKAHDAYTRPIVDSVTGIRMRNYFWLRKAQKANILVLGLAPIPAPAWTYSKYLRYGHKSYSNGILPKTTLEQELVAQALNATVSSFFPLLREAIYAVQRDAQIRGSLMIWHGHWPLDPSCTNLGLPKHIPRIAQFWTTERDLVDPWTFYYNLQIYMQDRILPELLPHFDILYLPLSLPPDTSRLESPLARKDCIRQGRNSLEAVFFSALFQILELYSFAPGRSNSNRP